MSDSKEVRILYMEDDLGNARLLQKNLQQKGYFVDIVSNGEEGLEMLKAGSYDILLVDYNMPGYGGLEVINILTSKGTLLPTIMVTGSGNEKVAVEAMKLGAADYIVKDIEMRYIELLPVVIEKVLYKQKLITERQEMLETIRENEERYRRLYELSPDGIFIYDEARLEFVNTAGTRLLGASTFGDVKGNPIINFIHPNYHQIFKDRTTELERQTKTEPWFEIKLNRLDGKEVPVELMAISFQNMGKQIVQIIIRDITERKLAEHRLQYLAHYDSLTGIPNRVLFFDRLNQALAEAKQYNRKLAVLFLDMDNFKFVNDTLGHDAGDMLLKEAAQRLTGCARASDTVARMGGDEFIIILSKILETQDARIVVRRIFESLAMPFHLKGQDCSISVSIGISLYPFDGNDSEALLRNADTALYRAKEHGNTHQFYSSN